MSQQSRFRKIRSHFRKRPSRLRKTQSQFRKSMERAEAHGVPPEVALGILEEYDPLLRRRLRVTIKKHRGSGHRISYGPSTRKDNEQKPDSIESLYQEIAHLKRQKAKSDDRDIDKKIAGKIQKLRRLQNREVEQMRLAAAQQRLVTGEMAESALEKARKALEDND